MNASCLSHLLNYSQPFTFPTSLLLILSFSGLDLARSLAFSAPPPLCLLTKQLPFPPFTLLETGTIQFYFKNYGAEKFLLLNHIVVL